jgi:hypothetical protein
LSIQLRILYTRDLRNRMHQVQKEVRRHLPLACALHPGRMPTIYGSWQELWMNEKPAA